MGYQKDEQNLKKIILALIVVFAVTGCSNKTQTQETVESKATKTLSEDSSNEKSTVSDEEKEKIEPAFGMLAKDQGKLPPVIDGVLTVPGQTTPFEYGGTLELKKIIEPKKTIKSGPLNITIQSIKLFEVTGLSDEYHASFSQRAGIKVGSTINYVQIFYEMKNTNDHDVEFFGMDKIVLSNGQQIERTNSFIKSTFGDSVFYGPVIQKETLALLYDGKSDEISSIRLIFGPVYDAEDKGITTLSDTKKLDLKF